MNFLELIQIFFEAPRHRSFSNFFETMYCLTSSLKKQGLNKEDITQEIIDEISKGFLNPSVKELYRTKFEYYLIYYLGFLMDLDYEYEHVENFEKIVTTQSETTDEATKLDGLDPLDLKDKEYSTEFLTLIGASEEDVR